MIPRRLLPRLLASHLAVAVGTLAILGVALDRLQERRLIHELRSRLVAEARSIGVAIQGDADPQDEVERIGAAAGTRITVIRTDGVVVADSERDPASMENHANRPEVRGALTGRIGSHQRVSDTVGLSYLYVSVPPIDNLIVRTALPAAEIARQRNSIRATIGASFLAIGLIAFAVSAFVARGLATPMDRMAREVEQVGKGEASYVTTGGPEETRFLARAINRMAEELSSRVEEIRAGTALRDEILDAMSEGVLLLDRGEVAFANPAARTLLSMGEENVLPPDLPVPTTEPVGRDVVVHHPQLRELRCVVLPLPDGRHLALIRDVTEANRIDRVRRDFVANASHEMKTPVASVLATAETLQAALADDPVQAPRFARILTVEARRLSALINDLLDLSRLDRAGKNLDPIELGEIVHEVIVGVRAEAEAKHLALSVTAHADVVVMGDGDDLALLARNLLDNAIRYTPDGGSVDVSVRREDGAGVLEVRDTGAGIPTRDVPRIFERFYRVDRARSRDTGGTGLGLAIVRHVAEGHGGTVTAQSRLGSGSVFTVRLPLKADAG